MATITESSPVLATTPDGGQVVAEAQAFQMMEVSIPKTAAEDSLVRHIKPIKLTLVRYGIGQAQTFQIHIEKQAAVNGHKVFAFHLQKDNVMLEPTHADYIKAGHFAIFGAPEPAHGTGAQPMYYFIVKKYNPEGVLQQGIDAIGGVFGSLTQKHPHAAIPVIPELGLAFPDKDSARGWHVSFATCIGLMQQNDPTFVATSKVTGQGTLEEHVVNRLARTWGT